MNNGQLTPDQKPKPVNDYDNFLAQAVANVHIPGEGPVQAYRTLEEYYAENVRNRELSPEADYGCQWQMPGDPEPWRVTYVARTGEIYAKPSVSAGPLLVLGEFPPDIGEPFSIYYKSLDQVLAGWPERCQQPGGIAWVRKQIVNAVRNLGE